MKVEFTNFDLTVRQITVKMGDVDAPLITFGPGSYLVSGILEYGSVQGHVLIGRYSSLGNRVTFIIGLNHDKRGVTTYPFLDVMHPTNDGTINHYFDVNHYQIIIGNDVWIGTDATILGGVQIGNGAVIGARAVVTKDVPPYAVVVGNPARIVKYRFDQEIIDGLQKIKWWNWPREKIEENLDLMKNVESFVAHHIREIECHEDKSGISDQMKSLRQNGIRIYAFIADFMSVYPVWKKVLRGYLQTFSAEESVVLLFGTTNQEFAQKFSGEVQDILESVEDSSHVAVLGDVTMVLSEFVGNADVFITTRESISSWCVDLAAGCGVRILSGLDYDIFRMDRKRFGQVIDEVH